MTPEKHPLETVREALEKTKKRHEKIRNALDFIRYGSFSRKDRDSNDGQAMADAGNNLSGAHHELNDALTALTLYMSQPQSCAECERLGMENADQCPTKEQLMERMNK